MHSHPVEWSPSHLFVAIGTFIYVAIVEILPKELADPECKGLKVLMVFVGFGLMALLAVWA